MIATRVFAYLTIAAVAAALIVPGCGGGSSTQPSATNSLTITSTAPPSGSTVGVPLRSNGTSALVLPGSTPLAVTIRMTAGASIPWAQLNVYLLDASGGPLGYCGQNTPDSPTYGLITSGWSTTVTVTGFDVYRVPCDVTGVRAMLHMRQNGLLTPPTASETIAEATAPLVLHLQAR